MRELPYGHIEIRRDDHLYRLWLTPDIHRLLRLYAQQTDISITDAGNRIILGFLTKVYGFEDPNKLLKETYKALSVPTRPIVTGHRLRCTHQPR